MVVSKVFLSIVIPIYNEEKSIPSFFPAVQSVLQKIPKTTEIIVVNDGSTDSSLRLLQKISGIHVISYGENQGYGFAIKRGILQARGEWICIIDADKTYPIESLPNLLEHCGKYDMVVGARNSHNANISFFRKPAKFILGNLANYVSGKKIPDLNSGFRIFDRKKAQEFFYLLPDKFSFTTTITLAFLTSRYPTKYVPIEYRERVGNSKVRPEDFIAFSVLIIKTMIFFKPLRIFFPIAGILFLLTLLLWYNWYFLHGPLMDTTMIISFFLAVNVTMFGLLAEIMSKSLKK